jgi:hypothetical protein
MPARSLYLRRAVISRLRTYADLTEIVPAQRLYGMKPPATPDWPFTRYGRPDETARPVSCWDGSEVAFVIHSFSKAEFEDECAGINAAIEAALNGEVLVMAGNVKAWPVWLGSQILEDGAVAGAWHGINRFGARI